MTRSTTRRGALLAAVLALTLIGAGCSDERTSPAQPASPTRASSPRPPEPVPEPGPELVGSRPPAWLGTRPLPLTDTGFGEVRPTPPELRRRRFTLPDELPPLAGVGFAAKVAAPAPAEVIARSTWHRGCPVPAADLAWVRLTFWGFDGRRHTGELLVAAEAAGPVVGVFRRLYAQRFPIEQMSITTAAELAAPPTGDGNNSEGFVCRQSVGSGSLSEHAYGLAVDVNPFQNPYHRGPIVLPELASAFLHRDWLRPGMVTEGGPVVAGFAAIGWGWGGTWQHSSDYQHFSASGR